MTSGTPAPMISVSSEDRQTLGDAIAVQVADLPHPPRLLGFGEPTHGEDEFLRLRNAIFAALVEKAGFTSIALESSAWHGRVVDAYVQGDDGVEDDIMVNGFTHGFGESAANRALVRWMREQNQHRPRTTRLRFAGFDSPNEMAWAPSPRPALRVLHNFLSAHAEVPAWDTIDQLIGPDEPWEDQAAGMEAARSIGADPRVAALRAITDDMRWILVGEGPRLSHETDDLDDALLAGRTAAGLLAYHAAMARDTENRWHHLGTIRDKMMADNLEALAKHGPVLVFAHNQHLRRGTTSIQLGPAELRWQPAGTHLADRFGSEYHIIAAALGEATHLDIPEPPSDTLEGVLYQGLPPGNHLLSAGDLQTLQRRCTTYTSPTYRYIPFDDTVLGEVDEVLFVRAIKKAIKKQDAAEGAVR
jgi:erythromycin esterase-like protein